MKDESKESPDCPQGEALDESAASGQMQPESSAHPGVSRSTVSPDLPNQLTAALANSTVASRRGPKPAERARRRVARNLLTGRSLFVSKGCRPLRTIEDLPLSSITTTRIRNSRLGDSEADFKMLVESMHAEGLLHPIIVMEDPFRQGLYSLVAGYRRLRGAAELGWRTIRATVIAVESEADACLVNLSENAARREISTCEFALYCQFMIEHFDLSETDLAERLGYTYTHIHQLVRYLSLPSPIVDAWRQRHPLLTLGRLQRLAASPMPLELWAKLQARHTLESGQPVPTVEEMLKKQLSEEEVSDDGHRVFRAPSKARLMRLRDVFSRMRFPSETRRIRQMIVDTVDYCRGARPTIPGVVFPPLGRRR